MSSVDPVEPVAEHGERVALEERRIEQREDLVAEVLHGLPVGEVAEVADEEHAAPFAPAGTVDARDALGERQGEHPVLAEEVGEEAALLVGDGDDGIGGVVGVQLLARVAAEGVVQLRAPDRTTAGRPAGSGRPSS